VGVLLLAAHSSGDLDHYWLTKRKATVEPAVRARDLLGDLLDSAETSPREIEQLAGIWTMKSSTKTSGKVSTGTLQFEIAQGRITMTGVVYGASARPIAQIQSEVCDYQPHLQQLLLVYDFAGHNDDGSHVLARCVLNGMLFDDGERDGLSIRGSWFHLQSGPSGPPPWGSATLTRHPDGRTAGVAQ
jgi:hypothetical protein